MSYEILKTPGTTANFGLLPNSILPMSYTNVEVLGVVSHAIAMTVEDITAKYLQILPFIPGIESDFTKADYVIVKHQSGSLEVLALSWINESTITSSSTTNKLVKLWNVSDHDNLRIAKMLRLNGFTEFTIENI